MVIGIDGEAGPHLTSLRTGSSLRYVCAGMTILGAREGGAFMDVYCFHGGSGADKEAFELIYVAGIRSSELKERRFEDSRGLDSA
jgi:hypothetical protein